MPDAGSVRSMGLSDRERAIIDFERSWWVMSDAMASHNMASDTVASGAVASGNGAPGVVTPGTKEAAIRARLDLSPTRYYELLRVLSGSAEAAAYDPLVIRRLRRSQSQRRRARLEGWPASQPPGR